MYFVENFLYVHKAFGQTHSPIYPLIQPHPPSMFPLKFMFFVWTVTIPIQFWQQVHGSKTEAWGVSNEVILFLFKQLLAVTSNISHRNSAPSMLRLKLIGSHLVLVHVVTATVSSCIQEYCYAWQIVSLQCRLLFIVFPF